VCERKRERGINNNGGNNKKNRIRKISPHSHRRHIYHFYFILFHVSVCEERGRKHKRRMLAWLCRRNFWRSFEVVSISYLLDLFISLLPSSSRLMLLLLPILISLTHLHFADLFALTANTAKGEVESIAISRVCLKWLTRTVCLSSNICVYSQSRRWCTLKQIIMIQISEFEGAAAMASCGIGYMHEIFFLFKGI
jgi:hypothetical protein